MSPARMAGVYGPTGFDMCVIVVARLALMVGGIIIAVALLLVFPVAIILSGGVMTAMLSTMLNGSLGSKRPSTEAVELSDGSSHH